MNKLVNIPTNSNFSLPSSSFSPKSRLGFSSVDSPPSSPPPVPPKSSKARRQIIEYKEAASKKETSNPKVTEAIETSANKDLPTLLKKSDSVESSAGNTRRPSLALDRVSPSSSLSSSSTLPLPDIQLSSVEASATPSPTLPHTLHNPRLQRVLHKQYTAQKEKQKNSSEKDKYEVTIQPVKFRTYSKKSSKFVANKSDPKKPQEKKIDIQPLHNPLQHVLQRPVQNVTAGLPKEISTTSPLSKYQPDVQPKHCAEVNENNTNISQYIPKSEAQPCNSSVLADKGVENKFSGGIYKNIKADTNYPLYPPSQPQQPLLMSTVFDPYSYQQHPLESPGRLQYQFASPHHFQRSPAIPDQSRLEYPRQYNAASLQLTGSLQPPLPHAYIHPSLGQPELDHSALIAPHSIGVNKAWPLQQNPYLQRPSPLPSPLAHSLTHSPSPHSPIHHTSLQHSPIHQSPVHFASTRHWPPRNSHRRQLSLQNSHFEDEPRLSPSQFQQAQGSCHPSRSPSPQDGWSTVRRVRRRPSKESLARVSPSQKSPNRHGTIHMGDGPGILDRHARIRYDSSHDVRRRHNESLDPLDIDCIDHENSLLQHHRHHTSYNPLPHHQMSPSKLSMKSSHPSSPAESSTPKSLEHSSISVSPSHELSYTRPEPGLQQLDPASHRSDCPYRNVCHLNKKGKRVHPAASVMLFVFR